MSELVALQLFKVLENSKTVFMSGEETDDMIIGSQYAIVYTPNLKYKFEDQPVSLLPDGTFSALAHCGTAVQLKAEGF